MSHIRLSKDEKGRITSYACCAWLRADREIRENHDCGKHAGFDGGRAEDFIWKALYLVIPEHRQEGYVSSKTIAKLVETAKREINSHISSMKWLADKESREYIGPESHLNSHWGGWTPPEGYVLLEDGRVIKAPQT